MFIKLKENHLPIMTTYIEQFNDDVIYFKKPVEQFGSGNLQGVFYGYIENAQLLGIFYFSNKSVMILHCVDVKILGNLQLLKTIKQHKPKYVKGVQLMVDAIYKLLCRTVSSTLESKSMLMMYEGVQLPVQKNADFSLITGENKIVDELLSDLRFFIDVDTHFGRPVKAIKDIIKEFKTLIEQENYVLAIMGSEIVGQGLVEDETTQIGLISGIYVSPKFRKKGIGEMITSALTNQLVLRGKAPYLFVKNNNENARRLYEKIGYKSIKTYSMLTITY